MAPLSRPIENKTPLIFTADCLKFEVNEINEEILGKQIMNDPLATTTENKPDYSSYIEGWKRRQQREKAAIEKRRSQARQIAVQATEILKQHGATKVILFGSILDHTFKRDSDIDLAVEMPSQSWWEWYLKLGEKLNFPIDLVHLRYIQQGFREIILQFGEVLYDDEKWDSNSQNADRKRVEGSA